MVGARVLKTNEAATENIWSEGIEFILQIILNSF